MPLGFRRVVYSNIFNGTPRIPMVPKNGKVLALVSIIFKCAFYEAFPHISAMDRDNATTFPTIEVKI